MTARQTALLWPGPISERRVRQVFAGLRACGLLERDRRAIKYAPSNAHLLLNGATEGGRLNWEDLHTLTPRGVRYVAHNRELPYAAAKSRYNRTYSDGRREHAYLRNEFYALHAAGSGREGLRPRLDRCEAEGGVGRLEIPVRPGRRARILEPDGLMRVSRPKPWGHPPDGGKRIRRIFYVESDTGSQDHVVQIADKVFNYCAWFLATQTGQHGNADQGHPRVLFVSPTRKRARTVWTFMGRAALEWKRSPLQDLDARRRREGHEKGALDLFCTTSLQAVRERGAWEHAYAYLCDRRKSGELF